MRHWYMRLKSCKNIKLIIPVIFIQQPHENNATQVMLIHSMNILKKQINIKKSMNIKYDSKILT